MTTETMNSLLESWKRRVRENMARRDDYSDGRASAFEACIDELEAALSQSTAGAAGRLSMRYFANGPEGSFMADDIALAHLICDGFDREEWTITDTHESPARPPADTLHDGTLSKSTAKRVSALSAAEGQSVEQRARELLAAEYKKAGYQDAALWIRTDPLTDDEHALDRCVLRAITAALSAQFTDNGADAECACTFQVIRDGVAYCGDCGRTISAQAPSEAVAGIIEGEFGDDGSLSNWQPWRVFRDDDGALWLTTDDCERDIEIDAEQDAAPQARVVDQ